MDDLLIYGGQVLDGTNAPARLADVRVRDGRIVAIHAHYAGDARHRIDATGQIVAPGFIDIHSHSDFTLPVNPKAESKVRQGVTTEVPGNCGFSAAPVLPAGTAMMRDYFAYSAPWLEFHPATFAAYLDRFPATSVNTILQVGHNTLRLMAIGMDRRAASPCEMATMQRLLEEALDAGALGLSSGLFTAPGAYADGDEMFALAQIVRRRGGAYSAHVRDEANGLFDAVREAITIGETCGIHVQISHLKLSGSDRWGGAAKLLEVIAAARHRGAPLDCEQYPYTAASNPLRNLLPVWVQDGGLEMMLGRLTQPATRARIRAEIAAHGLTNFGHIPDWDAVHVSLSRQRPDYVGQTIAQIARSGSGDPVDAVCECLTADRGATRILVSSIAEQDVRELLKTPTVFVGSDGSAVAPYGPTSLGKPHPRFYGTFPRVLGRYVRDLALLSLPQAIHKMTGGPAAALGLVDRGLLREGHWADITIFNPAIVAEQATYDDPHHYAVGIVAVIVNGAVVIDRGEHTGALPGKVLRRGRSGIG